MKKKNIKDEKSIHIIRRDQELKIKQIHNTKNHIIKSNKTEIRGRYNMVKQRLITIDQNKQNIRNQKEA